MSNHHQYAADQDLLKICIDRHYNRMLLEKKRVQIHVDHFDTITMVEATYYDKTERDWFLNGVPCYTYWLTEAQRKPIVKKLFKAGYPVTRIAMMLGFSYSPIYADVAKMRANGELPPKGVNFRVKAEVVKSQFEPERVIPKVVVKKTRTARTQQEDLKDFAFNG